MWTSAERERERVDARVQELDLEKTVLDGIVLPDQLVKPLFHDDSVSLVIDVNPVS